MINKKLEKAIKANLELINQFVSEFTEKEVLDETLQRIIGVDNYNPTDVFELSDMFLTLTDVFEYYLNKCTPEQFSEWYWWDLENKLEGRKTMNLKHYLISLKEKSII